MATHKVLDPQGVSSVSDGDAGAFAYTRAELGDILSPLQEIGTLGFRQEEKVECDGNRSTIYILNLDALKRLIQALTQLKALKATCPLKELIEQLSSLFVPNTIGRLPTPEYALTSELMVKLRTALIGWLKALTLPRTWLSLYRAAVLGDNETLGYSGEVLTDIGLGILHTPEDVDDANDVARAQLFSNLFNDMAFGRNTFGQVMSTHFDNDGLMAHVLPNWRQYQYALSVYHEIKRDAWFVGYRHPQFIERRELQDVEGQPLQYTSGLTERALYTVYSLIHQHCSPAVVLRLFGGEDPFSEVPAGGWRAMTFAEFKVALGGLTQGINAAGAVVNQPMDIVNRLIDRLLDLFPISVLLGDGPGTSQYIYVERVKSGGQFTSTQGKGVSNPEPAVVAESPPSETGSESIVTDTPADQPETRASLPTPKLRGRQGTRASVSTVRSGTGEANWLKHGALTGDSY